MKIPLFDQLFSRHKNFSLSIIIYLSLILFSCQESHINTSNKEYVGELIAQSVAVASKNNIDSAIIIIDRAITEAQKIEHDSLLVVGLMQKANSKSILGDNDYADSAHTAILNNNLYDIDSSLISKVKLSYAHLLMEWGQYDKALLLCQEANAYYEHIQYDRAIVAGKLTIANVYTQLLDYTSAMNALVKALEVSEKMGQKLFIAVAYFNMGNLYYEEQQYEKCIECYEIAAENYGATNIMINVAGSYENIGSAYIEMGEVKKAEEYILKARDIYTAMGAYSYAMNNLNKLGAVYESQNMNHEALKSYNEVLELNTKTNLPQIEANAYSNIGKLHYKKGNYQQAENCFEKAHNIRLASGDTDYRLHYKGMMQLHEAKKDWQEAYKWARKYDLHSDSIFNIEKFEATEELREKYETERKDLQLASLKVEKEKDQLTILKNKVIIYALGIVLSLTIIFIYFFQKEYRLKVQSYKDLVRKNEELIAIKNAKRKTIEIKNVTIEKKSNNHKKKEKSKIADNIITEVNEKLATLIDDKFYTNINLTLNETADELGTNTRYLSQIINDTYKCNFPTFINQLRVEEAQRLLKNASHHHLTIEFLGEKVGFKSKSAFNTAFKKETGVTPSYYKKNIE